MPRKRKPVKPPYTGWTIDHGISPSFLSKFITDRSRTHTHYCLGYREQRSREALDYGTIFHKLIEESAKLGTKTTRSKLSTILNTWLRQKFASSTSNFGEIVQLGQIALIQFLIYHDYISKLEKYTFLDQELVFSEHVELPSVHSPEVYSVSHKGEKAYQYIIQPGTTIKLKGRIDELLDRNGEMWLQENKTKSRIDPNFIQQTLEHNIQVMFYAVCAELRFNRPCGGIVYNVIRRPGLQQRQKENDLSYYKRIQEAIETDPNYYFYRFVHAFKKDAVENWKRKILLPHLCQVYLWWRSIEADPTNPWLNVHGEPNLYHFEKPFGIYDPMSLGKGDFFDYVTRGIVANLFVEKEYVSQESEGIHDPTWETRPNP